MSKFKIGKAVYVANACLFMFIANSAHSQSAGSAAETFVNQKMQQCLSTLNADNIKLIKDDGLDLNKKINQLCLNNKRNKAQSQAMSFAMQLQKSKDIYIIKRCELITDSPDKEIKNIMQRYFISDLRFTHICDQSS